MNSKELCYFEQVIKQEIAELHIESKSAKTSRAIVELDQQAIGRLSRMDALQSQALANAALSRRRVRLRRLQSALTRITTSEFGYCDDCGEAINIKRLAAEPTILKCLSCAN
ncbi:TraR/DksA family transcriptional regulator [Pseudopelagicola sp. nBUS_19]|uniref:TraR/DksA family transcriptional regulator n=1 Tax=unclassified Pseudopelagicola TaxID=2649563 RepID=UPI003EBE6C42